MCVDHEISTGCQILKLASTIEYIFFCFLCIKEWEWIAVQVLYWNQAAFSDCQRCPKINCTCILKSKKPEIIKYSTSISIFNHLTKLLD